MIVADASVVIDLLMGGPHSGSIRVALSAHSEMHVPEHFHVEVISALRRRSLRHEMGELRAAEALTALRELRTITYPVIEMVEEIWSMRVRLTAYDAAYLALAQRLDLGLITLDGGLAKAAETDGRLVALTG